ncbi:MAG: DUF480 domain-containing protein [Phycisphaerales bacterium]|nr:DUF480 domain-containing protein [Phycisphaerales bacterium]
MPMLTADECRVLGVLIEKAQTTPAQYPMSLNALTAGANQKNNRDPVTELSEERVFDAVDSLRRKGLVREVMLSGSRVSKFKHEVRERFAVSLEEMVILAELWLRGPQSAGELRGRASRMHTLGSVEDVQRVLEGMKAPRESVGGPMVEDVPPGPGERAHRYAQVICPGLHPLHAGPGAAPAGEGAVEAMKGGAGSLESRVRGLEDEVAELRAQVAGLAARLERAAGSA